MAKKNITLVMIVAFLATIIIFFAYTYGMQSLKIQRVKNFVNSWDCDVSKIAAAKKEFSRLFPVGYNLSNVEYIFNDNLKKSGIHPSLIPYLGQKNIPLKFDIWFKKCINGDYMGMEFFVDPENNIIKKDLFLGMSAKNFFSYNIPFTLEYFNSAKDIEIALKKVLKEKKIKDIDKFMLSIGAEKITEEKNSKKISYHYFVDRLLFNEALQQKAYYVITLDIDDKEQTVNIEATYNASFP